MEQDHVHASVVNAFTMNGAGGNPAGVVLDAGRLTRAQKQSVAAKMGLSETAFVSPSATADFKLEFFTPTRQIAHCGHATIATFSLLAQQGQLRGQTSSKETIDGRREIMLDGDRVYMQQLAPKFTPLGETSVTLPQVLGALGLTPDELLSGAAPLVVNTGNAFLVIGVNSNAVLAGLQPDMEKIGEISDALQLIGVYAFAPAVQNPNHHADARMFAPLYGIPEEAATGMAAGPLGAYLHQILGVQANPILIGQGAHMTPPSPSELEVHLSVAPGVITAVTVGGRATKRESRDFRLSEL
ncbi:PhzF family phenazine biosynthesis protein [Deinococcus hopiensis]|uniref:Phenazine biosynthesis protein PhzF family n=1 Tax=Deinococcus hopiensis KR-140 TaxID=695939 RepID=A0A1W1UQ12_9DEIO|nr:PhzF family phenazine biosynthesis protein [Deinococcus hopiensis]SMB83192.1 phenazine biosynthesis protein PhzF family [Deinococcus hopiensis KR-140]